MNEPRDYRAFPIHSFHYITLIRGTYAVQRTLKTNVYLPSRSIDVYANYSQSRVKLNENNQPFRLSIVNAPRVMYTELYELIEAVQSPISPSFTRQFHRGAPKVPLLFPAVCHYVFPRKGSFIIINIELGNNCSALHNLLASVII